MEKGTTLGPKIGAADGTEDGVRFGVDEIIASAVGLTVVNAAAGLVVAKSTGGFVGNAVVVPPAKLGCGVTGSWVIVPMASSGICVGLRFGTLVCCRCRGAGGGVVSTSSCTSITGTTSETAWPSGPINWKDAIC